MGRVLVGGDRRSCNGIAVMRIRAGCLSSIAMIRIGVTAVVVVIVGLSLSMEMGGV